MRKCLFLILFLSLLTGCAQMGSIDGGPTDTTAPRLTKGGIQPPNESLHFNSKNIHFQFEEFIKLNNPIQTLSVVPNDVQLKSEVKGKQLKLTIEGEPKPNTTYVITMNGTVQDITEANDSLMQYVFSTGDFIDSLQYNGVVVDAKTHTPVKDCFVGLYETNDSAIYQKPLYYATTNVQGEFNFRYLKPGRFDIYAFIDANKDSKWQITEKMAFIDSSISISQIQPDTLHLLLFQPTLPQKLKATYAFPSKYTISGRNPIDLVNISVDSVLVPTEMIHWYGPDSMSVINFSKNEKATELVVKHQEDSLLSDTLIVRKPSARTLSKLKPTFEILSSQKEFFNGDSISIAFTDEINNIHPDKMELLVRDSIPVPFRVDFKDNQLTLFLKGISDKLVNFNVLKGGIIFKNYSDSLIFTHLFKMVDESTLGSLTLDVSKLPDNTILEMYAENNLLHTFILAKTGKKIQLDKLHAGSYRFTSFIDTNNDGLWTTGDWEMKRQPEKTIRFKEAIKVRANWDIEAELIPLDEQQE